MSKTKKINIEKILNLEAQKMIDEGFDPKLVREVLLENGESSITNLVSQGASSIADFGGAGVVQYVKNQMLSWLLEKLGLDPKSFFSIALSNMFANLQFKDYWKFFTDCEFTTALVAKTLIESFIDQFRIEAGYEGFIYGALKETLVEAAASSDLYIKLSEKIEDKICSFLHELGEKYDLSPLKVT